MHSLETRRTPTMVSSRRRTARHVLLAALGVLAVTACGDDSEPGIQGDPTIPVPAPGPAPPPGEAEAERSLGAVDVAP